jgi:hypothetical protein
MQATMPQDLQQPDSPTAGPLAHLLLITHESVGEKMAGPGIRSWELARAIGQHGARVTLATPFPSQRSAPNVEICTYSWDDPASLTTLIDQADAVMAIGWVIARINSLLARPIEKPVIVDVYYVPEIEQIMLNLVRQELGFDPTPVFMQEMSVYLRQGDFFTCTLNSQYDFWLGALMSAGRINEANLKQHYNVDHLMAVVPFGLPDTPPPPLTSHLKGVLPGIGAQDKILYWGGGIWDWTDPFTFMDALKIVNQQRSDVRAVFGALHHFSSTIVPAMNAASRLAARVESEGWLGSRVFFLDWIPYDQRGDYLLEADLGVSLVAHTLENRYAIRSRLLDHLWTGLPGVLSQGDEMAGVLASTGLAKLMPPGDVQGTAQAILDYLEQPGLREQMQPALADFRQRFAWSNVVLPVVEFLRSPRRAPDGDNARSMIGEMTHLRREYEDLRTEKTAVEKALREEIHILRSSRPVRMADALGNILQKFGIKL